MSSNPRVPLLVSLFILFPLFISAGIDRTDLPFRPIERGDLSIYFLGEQVGYEEYTWQESERGYRLSIRGRMTKPVAIEVDRMIIELDRSFIPIRYSFKGEMGGIKQEILSEFSEGDVIHTIHVSGQEQRVQRKVKRDAFLLPNPIFSPYVVITKKFGCRLEEKIDLSAYLIPQLETSFILEPKEEEPCVLLMDLNGTVLEIETDEDGRLISLLIPSQNLRVTSLSISSY